MNEAVVNLPVRGGTPALENVSENIWMVLDNIWMVLENI